MTVAHLAAVPAFNAPTQLVLPLSDGLFNGCAYGLLALGIVLLYKSNRILNFAQGEFAGIALIVSYCFDNGYSGDIFGVPLHFPQVWYPVAVVLGVASAVLAAVLTQLLVIRPLFNRPKVTIVIATVGVALLMVAVEGFIYPAGGGRFRQIQQVASLGKPPMVDKIPLNYGDLLRLVVLVALALAALVFFRRTATGTAILAVSQDPTAAEIVGIQVQRVSLITWAIAGFLGGMAGVLPVATDPVQPGVFTGLVLVSAFVAAVIGGITSLPGAFLGGILLGLVEAFADRDLTLVPTLSKIPALPEVVVVLLLLVVLVIRPAGLLGKEV